jgi:hypothetical protein
MFFRVVRWLANSLCGGLLLAITAGVFSEFFIEAAKDKGLYSGAGSRLDAAMTAFSEFVLQTWFLCLTTLSIGFAAGLGLDALMRRRERKSDQAALADARKREKEIAEECIRVSEDIRKERIRWEQTSPDIPSGPDPKHLADIQHAAFLARSRVTRVMGAEFGVGALASLSRLASLGIPIPAFARTGEVGDDTIVTLSRLIAYHLTDTMHFLGIVGGALLADGLDEAKRAAKGWEVVGGEPATVRPRTGEGSVS